MKTRQASSLWWGLVDIALLIILLSLLGGCIEAIRLVVPYPQQQRVEPSVAIMPIVQNHLDFLFFAVAERANLEAWFCLKGFVDKKTRAVLIQGISPIWVDSADGMNIVGKPSGCPPESIGTIHFHPPVGSCEFSDIDINTAHWLPFEVEALVCRPNKDSAPKVVVILREEFDALWDKMPKTEGGGTRAFSPVYRYARKPP